MNILKREVLVSKSAAHKGIFISVAVGTVLVPILLVIGMTIGYSHGLYVGAQSVAIGGNPSLVEEAPDACGIANPLACVRSMVESVADVFHPAHEFTVTVTPTYVVDCKLADLALDQCDSDDACSNETFEAIAEYVNFCRRPLRR